MQLPVRVTGDGTKFWCPLCTLTRSTAADLEAHVRIAHNARRPIEVVDRDAPGLGPGPEPEPEPDSDGGEA